MTNIDQAVSWVATILGEPASKSNSRRLVVGRSKKTGKLHPKSIKSKKALAYSDSFKTQISRLKRIPLYTVDLEIDMRIYYANQRSDLDESLVLDLLQGYVYENDRQIKKKTIEWGLDRVNPRCVIEVKALEGGINTGRKRRGKGRQGSR